LKKIFPLLLISIKNFLYESVVLVMVFVTIIISLLNLFMKQNKIKVFLAWSSNINFSLILFIMQEKWIGGVMYLMFYLVMVIVFLRYLKDQKIYWDQFSISNVFSVIGLLVGLCAFSGLPPFLGFFCKYFLLFRLNKMAENSMSLFVFFFFFFFFVFYFFFFFFFFFVFYLCLNFYFFFFFFIVFYYFYFFFVFSHSFFIT